MKFLYALLFLPLAAHADAPRVNLHKIAKIICSAVDYYDADAPNEKTPAIAGDIKIFTPGSRADVKPAPGAFVLDEYVLAKDTNLWDGNQQFYFSVEKDGTLSFAFLAGWKASGSLVVTNTNAPSGQFATGSINQKGHVTDLNCFLQPKK